MTPGIRAPRRRPLTEAEWQEQVIDLAVRLGWEWLHIPTVSVERTDRDGRRRVIHVTATRGPLGDGLADLMLMRERILFAELKGTRTPIEDSQREFRRKVLAAGHEHYFWRPDDLPEVQTVLARRAAP